MMLARNKKETCMKSNQFLFNKAASGLLKQGVKCVDEDGTCFYRREDGARCGVGMVIPNSVYLPAMEGMSAGYVIRNYPARLAKVGIVASHTGLLDAIQGIHDQNEPDEWPKQIAIVAKQFHLTMPRIAA